LKNLDYVNNWDLVDVSCYKIIGAFLLENREKIGILEELVKTDHLWRKRVAIISTLAFIKNK
jgi:3-methyladenine DNA glycosylase AlkD